MWGRTWHKVGSWLKKEEEHRQAAAVTTQDIGKMAEGRQERGHKSGPELVPSLPMPITFRRQDSERRERLYPHEPDAQERRATSFDHRKANLELRDPPTVGSSRTSTSLPAQHTLQTSISASAPAGGANSRPKSRIDTEGREEDPPISESREFNHPALSHDVYSDPELISEGLDDCKLNAEVESRWILNLSMHFRDKSDREKFFITYAEERNKWLRVTVTLDYRDTQPDSLEADLKDLRYQCDKSARIYQALRDSLSDIQFYPTVTNLKLQTLDGKLHVHVTEDMNEIIKYPSVSLVKNVRCQCVKESAVEFESHCSGFVYKVRTSLGNRNDGGNQRSKKRLYVKKEIPGPSSVDEFLYEVNVLYRLRESRHIIKFEGLVVSDDGQLVKGLLITFAPGGTLADLLYHYRYDVPHGSNARGTLLSLERRLKYAWQILSGLSTIHGFGFVQGDFTLSNVVLDADDDARLIDINRRGCPVGWEPPELKEIIHSAMSVGMFIGVKSDLWQCGMVLWALGRGIDEPERDGSLGEWDDPEVQADAEDVPKWYKEIVTAALQKDPRDRKSAAELLAMFPEGWNKVDSRGSDASKRGGGPVPAQARPEESESLNPDPAVGRDGVAQGRATESRSPARRSESRGSGLSMSDMTFADEIVTSTEYLIDSSGSYIVGQRGEEHLSDQRKGQAEAHRNTRLVPEPNICHAGGKEVLQSKGVVEEGASVGASAQRDKDDSTDDPKTKQFVRASTISTPVPASLLSERLRALAHVDSGFDEPKDSRKSSLAD